MSDIKGWILDALGGRPHSKDQVTTPTPSAEQLQQKLQQAQNEHEGIKTYSGVDRHPADIKAEEAAKQRVEEIQTQLDNIKPIQTEQTPPSAPSAIPSEINQQNIENQTVTPTQGITTEEKAA